MVIVCTSIPLAIFSAIIGLKLTGHTINIMTLGGLALAIGMLVDDATVEVENIHRNRGLGKPLTRAILDGAQQIAVPAIVATLADLHRLLPGRAAGRAGALPLRAAGARGRARDARVVPAVADAGADAGAHADGAASTTTPAAACRAAGPASRMRFNRWRDRRFERFQDAYGAAAGGGCCTTAGSRCWSRPASPSPASAWSFVVGTDFFPTVDAGLMKLHFRAPAGTRIEKTEELVAQVEARHPRRHPGRRARDDQRHDRRADLLQPRVRADRQRRRHGRRHPHRAQARAPPDRRLHAAASARMLARDFPGCELLLPAGRHRQPGAQLRPVGADRRADRVPRPRQGLRGRAPAARRDRRRCRAPPTCTSSRCSTTRRSTSTSTASAPRRSGSASATSPTTCSSRCRRAALVSPSYFLNPQNNVNYTVVVKTPLPKLASVERRDGDAAHAAAGAPLTADQRPASPSALPEAPAQTLGSVADDSARAAARRRSTTTPCSACSTSAPTSRARPRLGGRGHREAASTALGTLPQGHEASPCAGRTRS